LTSRGDGRDDIYLTDDDRALFLSVLGQVCERFNWECHSHCLMTNHYHLMIEAPVGNLSQGMRQLNGVYTQRFNQQPQRVGHVFQGRYKSILVQKESYLLELSRYIVLNPVRAGRVVKAENWQLIAIEIRLASKSLPISCRSIGYYLVLESAVICSRKI
jgi:putative transposase